MKDRGGNRRGARHTQRKREFPIPSPFSPLPNQKADPTSESANPSSQHQLDGSIVPIFAKRRKVNHSRFRIATQKPLPLWKRPPAGRGIGRRMNKQLVHSYGTDYSKGTSKSRCLHAAVSLKCTKPVPAIYMKLYTSTENTLIKLYNYIEKCLIKLYNEVKFPDFIA